MEAKRYYDLKARGICVCCGTAMAREGKTTCLKCYEHHKLHNYPSLDKPKEKPKKTAEYSLDDVAIMSREKGVSYGTMVAILECRKKG